MDNNYNDINLVELGLRIKQERESQELTLQNIADRTGVASSTIQRYEAGNFSKIKLPVINSIAFALNVNPAWILGKTEDKVPINNIRNISKHNENSTVKIKIYGKVPAGVPMEAIEDIVGEEDIPREWTLGGQEYIALRVTGDSMYPKYLDGDIVIIKIQPDCESGQDAVVYVNGYDATLKTIVKQDDGMIRLQPTNPEYKPKVYFSKNVTILGVVKRLRRDF